MIQIRMFFFLWLTSWSCFVLPMDVSIETSMYYLTPKNVLYNKLRHCRCFDVRSIHVILESNVELQVIPITAWIILLPFFFVLWVAFAQKSKIGLLLLCHFTILILSPTELQECQYQKNSNSLVTYNFTLIFLKKKTQHKKNYPTVN